MLRIADLYAYLCKSLEIEGANNGKSVYDGIIVLRSPETITVEKIADLLGGYCEFINTIVEPSESRGWIYIRARLVGEEGDITKRDIISGVCVTQYKETLTLIFGDTSAVSEDEEAYHFKI